MIFSTTNSHYKACFSMMNLDFVRDQIIMRGEYEEGIFTETDKYSKTSICLLGRLGPDSNTFLLF
jgi:hypothetical protein